MAGKVCKNEIHEEMKKKILAIASNGGHLVELQRMLCAFDGYPLIVVIARYSNAKTPDFPSHKKYVINDASSWNKLALLGLMIQVISILLKERPNVIISTGAAPGCFALMLGKILLRAQTIWVDSVANVETLSLSGQKVARYADLWLTQWQHLARPNGPRYEGTIL